MHFLSWTDVKYIFVRCGRATDFYDIFIERTIVSGIDGSERFRGKATPTAFFLRLTGLHDLLYIWPKPKHHL